jgi:hypothetical protein
MQIESEESGQKALPGLENLFGIQLEERFFQDSDNIGAPPTEQGSESDSAPGLVTAQGKTTNKLEPKYIEQKSPHALHGPLNGLEPYGISASALVDQSSRS